MSSKECKIIAKNIDTIISEIKNGTNITSLFPTINLKKFNDCFKILLPDEYYNYQTILHLQKVKKHIVEILTSESLSSSYLILINNNLLTIKKQTIISFMEFSNFVKLNIDEGE